MSSKVRIRTKMSRISNTALKLANSDLNADPDPVFHSNLDPNPDLASKNNAAYLLLLLSCAENGREFNRQVFKIGWFKVPSGVTIFRSAGNFSRCPWKNVMGVCFLRTFGESCRRPCRECRTQHAVRNPASWCPPRDWFRLKHIKKCSWQLQFNLQILFYKRQSGYNYNYANRLDNRRKPIICNTGTYGKLQYISDPYWFQCGSGSSILGNAYPDPDPRTKKAKTEQNLQWSITVTDKRALDWCLYCWRCIGHFPPALA